MKKLGMLLAVLLFVTTLIPGLAEEEKVLNIFTWDAYYDEDTLAQFQQETGIQVNYSVFASNEEMLLKMQNGSNGEYDLILASDYAISAMRKKDMLLPLNKELLTNWKNLNPDYLNQYFDPENVYSVPYTVGSPLIVYDPEQIEGEVTSFADLWQDQMEGGVWIIDDARVTIGETLKMLGYSYNTTDADEIHAAYEKLCELKKNISVMDYDMTYDYFASGEAKIGYLFTQVACLCMLENPQLKCVFPSEGIGFGIDSMVIPADAAHPENAHAFIDFYLRPDVAAYVAMWQGYINPNAAAEAQIDPDFAALGCFDIPQELLAAAEYIEDLGENESLFQDAWTNFKLY